MALTANGGPAFPLTERPASGGGTQQQGMSLRDWFASQALVGILANNPVADATIDAQTALAYKIADEMLKKRMAIPS